MPERIPQSTTLRVPLQAYLSSDHVSPATGKTIAVTISKNAGAYANPSGGATNATEIASGSYYVDLSTTDTGTLGPLFVLGTATGTDNVVAIYNVVKATNGGFTALPDANANANGGLPILSNSGTAIAYTVSTVTTLTNLPSIPNNWLTAAGIAASALNGKGDWLLSASYTAPPSSSTIAAAVWDEINTGSTHNVTNSTGKQLRTLALNTGVIYTSTAPSQSGMTSTQIKLDSGASAVDNSYQWTVVSIISGTGAGQSRIITAYVGSTRVATVDSAWTVQPDATSVFEITPTAKTQVVSYFAGQDPATLVLDVAASSHNTAGTIGAKINAISAAPSASAIATAVWTDTTSSDFAATSSPGKILVTQLGGAFTTTSSSVFTAAALANGPGGGGGSDPWATVLPGSYASGTAGNILGNNLNATVSSRLPTSSYTSPPSAAAIVSTLLAAALGSPRDLSAVADASMTVADAFWSAVSQGVGQWEVVAVNSTTGTLTIKTPVGTTTIRVFSLALNPDGTPYSRT